MNSDTTLALREEGVQPPQCTASHMLMLDVMARDAIDEAISLGHLMDWIEGARDLIEVIDRATAHDDDLKAALRGFGALTPSWEAAESRGLQVLVHSQRKLLRAAQPGVH